MGQDPPFPMIQDFYIEDHCPVTGTIPVSCVVRLRRIKPPRDSVFTYTGTASTYEGAKCVAMEGLLVQILEAGFVCSPSTDKLHNL